MKNWKDYARQVKSPTPSTAKPKVEPKPMGTPEERKAWSTQVAEQTVQGMRNRPKDFIPPY